jgi:hypothetical protein
VVPWAAHKLVASMHAAGTVLGETHDELGTTIRVRAPGRVIERLRDELATAAPAQA